MGVGGHRLKVLLVSHEHPAFGPGEIETYAHQLYGAMRKTQAVEPILLARVGFPTAIEFPRHLGTPFGLFEGDDHEYWVVSEISDFDWLNLTVRRKSLYTSYLKHFLASHEPDVVHVQNILYLGLDLLSLIKRTLPNASIVYTLHDYRPICHRDGVMVRTLHDEELCDHYSPRRCNECFPEIDPADFFMRKRFIEAQLGAVDLFVAPSQFLAERYVDWGLPEAKIRVSELGRPLPEELETEARETRDRFGFFGELSRHNGVLLVLETMEIVAETSRGEPEARSIPRLRLHGGNLLWQSFGFQDRFRQLVASLSPNVTLVERYEESELPGLMREIDWVVVPSLWWESAPLVVQDAFRYRKPVICPGIGALAEKVAHEVNGLHFRRGDPYSLAETIRLASESPALWQRLRDGIPPVRSIEEDAAFLVGTYRQLREPRAGVH
jgi:glycosyltransferase involved in cell wall biosynthesis